MPQIAVSSESATIAGTQFGSKIDTGEWAYNLAEMLNRLWDTTKESALTFGLTNIPSIGHNVAQQSQYGGIGDAISYPTEIETTFNIDEIRPQLKTDSNSAFFWSGNTDGVGGAKVAADIASTKNGVTLESLIDSKGISMPVWDLSDQSSVKAWDMASAAYAEQVVGEVRAIVGSKLRPGNIWENVELPRLKANPNVTRIIIIDPKTGIETTIFER